MGFELLGLHIFNILGNSLSHVQMKTLPCKCSTQGNDISILSCVISVRLGGLNFADLKLTRPLVNRDIAMPMMDPISYKL